MLTALSVIAILIGLLAILIVTSGVNDQ